MKKIRELIKKGNASSLYAVLGNLFLVIFKGVAAFLSGSGAMFAEAMHTGADAVNQFLFLSAAFLPNENQQSVFRLASDA